MPGNLVGTSRGHLSRGTKIKQDAGPQLRNTKGRETLGAGCPRPGAQRGLFLRQVHFYGDSETAGRGMENGKDRGNTITGCISLIAETLEAEPLPASSTCQAIK